MIKFYRTILAIFIGLFLTIFSIWQYGARSAPLLANYYLSWQIPWNEVDKLAKWDLLILDMETQVNSRAQIERIKALNPDIILLAYVTSEEISTNAATSASSLRRKLVSGIAPEWYLKKSNGESLSFWPGTVMLNPSANCPTINGRQWNDYLADFMAREVLATGLWSGIFYDNAFDSITWFSGSGIDLNLDKVNDVAPDDSWRAGMRELFSATYSADKNYLIVGNAFSDAYRHDNNGFMIENFQNLPWQDVLRLYRSQLNGQKTPRVVILNANTGNTGARADYRNFRYGLASTLVGGSGYYAFDYGDKDHGQTWWYDEYDVNLGAAVGEGASVSGDVNWSIGNDVYRRNYANGLALVNPTDDARTVDLDGEYEKIIGTQDKLVNSGGIVSKIDLPARDGLILRKTFQEVKNVFFINGGFVRFFSPEGARARNGFFVFAPGFAGGAQIFNGDLDSAEGVEKIVDENGHLRIFDNAGRIWQDSEPLFADAPNRLNLAVGVLERDQSRRIVMAADMGGAVLRATYYGAALDSVKYPLGKKYQYGFSVAIGDVDGGDGDVILGTRRGGAGEVIIMDKYLVKIKRRFYPYGKNFKTGVTVGAGDINGDNRAEILTAGKVGDKIIVKIFNGSGQKLKEFSAGAALGATRFNIGAADVDGDGRIEVVVGSE